METFKKFFLGVVGVIIGGFTIYLGYVGFFKNLNNGRNDHFVGLCTLFTGILAITGVCFTIFNSQRLKNQELLNELDQKSEWRKELMNIAAKPVMQLEDVYRILASLRFLPKSKDEIEGKCIKKSKQKEFDIISNFIYKKLNIILNKILQGSITEKTYTQNFLSIPLSIKDSEKIRLYTKFLLKHHWEYNKGEKDKKNFKKKELNEFKKVMDEIHRLNQEDNIKKGYYKTDKIYTGILDDYAKKLAKNNKDR